MLHGVLGQAANWARLLPWLPAGCHGVALEFPLFESPSPLATLEALEQYVAGFIHTLNAPRVVIAGNSIGGHVALGLALRLRERVAGLVLTGSSGLLERTYGNIPGIPPPREWLTERIREVFHDPCCTTQEMVDAISRVLAQRQHVRRLLSLFMSARNDNVTSRLGSIHCPVLLVWGRQDIVTPPAAALRFHQLLPDSELHWIDACGHVPMLEHPQRFAELLSDWWERRIAPVQDELCEVA
jgi:2-hydroxy-6-oxonona-2,4-dienedioate hydrolase